MDFFQVPPPDPAATGERPDPYRAARPGPWVGGVVPLEVVVARTDRAAIVLRGVTAYPDGFTLELSWHLHRSVKPSREPGRPLAMMGHWGGFGVRVTDDVLRFGLVWPDGGRATNLDHRGAMPGEGERPRCGLEVGSSSGSEDEFTFSIWAWPLPGPGDLTAVVEWPAYDIAETRAVVDGALVAEAAGRARPVWEEDAGKPTHLTHHDFTRIAQEAAPSVWAYTTPTQATIQPLE